MDKENRFLPVSKEEMDRLGWSELDIILITGDGYVDHPSFGIAIISRVLQAEGFKVGIIAQPDWRSKEDFLKLGKPRLCFMVSGGNLDSMVNNYTAARKKRHTDVYSPGGKAGYRPDRASIVYCNRLRELFGNTPIILGGLEASLRRFAHYDYWDDTVRRSLILDSRANLLVYGMGEKQASEIAHRLAQGEKVSSLTDVRGTVYRTSTLDCLDDYIMLPSYEDVKADKSKYAEAFKVQYEEQDPFRGKTLVQSHGDQFVVQNKPALPLSTKEMDAIYALPYQRTYHPCYESLGGIPAIKEVMFSITTHRGCFGGCAFCALTFHQGKIIQSRSKKSIIEEARLLTTLPGFKGIIHDVGGPTANFWGISCEHKQKHGSCKGKECLFPKVCPNLPTDHRHIVELLRAIRKVPGVKKVFVRSGVRYDFALADSSDLYLRELCAHHISGQLKVAPEHVSIKVTNLMHKPGKKVYDEFVNVYRRLNRELGKKQYLVPYFMSSHPGCGLKEMIELAEYIRDMGHYPEQVQDFTPTPSTLSTCMYYTGINPLTGQKVYVPKSPEEKSMQRALMQFRNRENYARVYKALRKAGRTDLIGSGEKCLINYPQFPTKARPGQKGVNRHVKTPRRKKID